jgi:hypothetical protein
MEFALRQDGWIIYQTNAGFRFTKEGAEGLAYEYAPYAGRQLATKSAGQE